MLELVAVGIAGAISLFGYVKSRKFVRERLRFVDSIQSPAAPFVAGSVAGLAAIPFAFLPLVAIPTAVLFGLGVGAGVAAGARDSRRLTGGN